MQRHFATISHCFFFRRLVPYIFRLFRLYHLLHLSLVLVELLFGRAFKPFAPTKTTMRKIFFRKNLSLSKIMESKTGYTLNYHYGFSGIPCKRVLSVSGSETSSGVMWNISCINLLLWILGMVDLWISVVCFRI